ncbi:unnamed protein product [Rotaria sordida]|uniref:Amino acid transporter transmembrane domain-containing protein n=1 Tax=Rotaria sordida TaxID=392033 RepID=A0A814YKR1_9BILA|nr:unnamed protein product [Rotaria sordida]CAF3677127.1 unnamed protein product [Rotaria sordida]
MDVQSDTSAIVDDENLALLNSDNELDVSVTPRSSMSWIMAAGLIVNAAMGAGLLNIVKAYDDAGGIFISSILHGVVVILVLGAYAILFVCSDQSISSYETFVLMKCGKVWQRICSVCIILYMYGLSITFFIIIGDQLDRFLTFFDPLFCRHWYFDRRFTIAITSLLLIFPLCFSKTIKFLQIPSPESWTDIFLVLPTMCFCYQAHVNAVPVFVALKSRADCIKATLASTIVLILSYCFVAICGYLTFGTKVDHDILMSYQPISAAVLIAIIMVAIKTYTAYPVNLFCGRTAIESLSNESTTSLIATNQRQSAYRRILIVCLWFFSTLAGAVFLPNISVAIHYLGALAASFIFIFPEFFFYYLGLCLYFHIEEQWINSWGNIISISIAIFYVAIGVFVTVLTLLQSLISDITANETSETKTC